MPVISAAAGRGLTDPVENPAPFLGRSASGCPFRTKPFWEIRPARGESLGPTDLSFETAARLEIPKKAKSRLRDGKRLCDAIVEIRIDHVLTFASLPESTRVVVSYPAAIL